MKDPNVPKRSRSNTKRSSSNTTIVILKIIWGKINYLNRILYNPDEGRKYKIISKMIFQGSVVQVVGKDWKTHRMARSLFKVLKANQYDK